MLEKIVRATMEDRLYRSIKKGIVGRWKALPKKIDISFGTFMRNRYMARIPVDNNKILFMTFQGDYTCNPKYVTEEILRRKLPYEIVWAKGDGTNSDKSKNKKRYFPEGIKTVEKNSLEFFQEMASAKVIVINSFLFKTHAMKLKKDQILIQTWHGSLGIKRIGKEDKKEDLLWINGMEKTSEMTKYCISNSSFETNVYRETFWKDTEILELGHARNDIFFSVGDNEKIRKELKEKIFEQYGLEADTKIILYAPTFRNSHTFSCYDIDVEGLLEEVTKKWGGKWAIMLRYHPSVKADSGKKNRLKGENIVNVTAYPDMQDLIAIADIGITDYSSWIYDYMLLRKPGFIFATDIEDYDTERGFYYPLSSTPFPVATNNEELLENVQNFDEVKYLQELEKFLEGKGCIDDGHASERIVDLIVSNM